MRGKCSPSDCPNPGLWWVVKERFLTYITLSLHRPERMQELFSIAWMLMSMKAHTDNITMLLKIAIYTES